MFKFKVGDKVKILSGKDKGKEGKIEKVFPKKFSVLIAGVNIYKKHVKGQSASSGQKAGIYEIPRPLPVSKIMLICPKTKKLTKIGFKTINGKKVRYSKKGGQALVAGSDKK
ncbi:50S ribosomal protein L24 [Candidatus Woesebacteria bacterium]|nr:MAG: 50S ribosomal protein L24 [Candidatus Woesebacteria bacterium]